jgi:hypothetical protein
LVCAAAGVAIMQDRRAKKIPAEAGILVQQEVLAGP